MRFLVDAQLPPALTRWLETKGHVAEHARDVGLLHASDGEIWDYALSANAAILTKDEDFSTHVTAAPPGPPVVWIRTGNTTNRALLEQLELLWPEVERALQRGEKLVEIV